MAEMYAQGGDHFKRFADNCLSDAVDLTAEPEAPQSETKEAKWERFAVFLLSKKEKTWLRTGFIVNARWLPDSL